MQWPPNRERELEFLFKQSPLDTEALAQGDVIARTDAVAACVGRANRRYASAPDYTHFVVLTQSCDLVKRRRGMCRAPQIAVAAAGPLEKVIRERIRREAKSIEGTSVVYHTKSQIAQFKQLLERYIHNTDDDHFFLPQSGHPDIPQDLLVFLRLPIALQREHYEILLKAKVAELEDVFRARLGWMKGNIYSRVATPDIEEMPGADAFKSKFYEKYLSGNQTVVMSGIQAKFLKRRILERTAEVRQALDTAEIKKLVAQNIPDDTEIVAQNIVRALREEELVDAEDSETVHRLASIIARHAGFKTLVGSANP